YFRVIHELFPELALPVHTSMVAHHMVMDPELVRALLREIETRAGGRPWWRALLDLVDRADASPLAEYELYGQWGRQRHPDRVKLVAFRNIGLSRGSFLAESPAQWARRGTDSVSSHWWIVEPQG